MPQAPIIILYLEANLRPLPARVNIWQIAGPTLHSAEKLIWNVHNKKD